jgi:hypothetical protein
MRWFEEPSDEEMTVIYWMMLIGALVAGAAAFYFSFKADTVENAIALRVGGAMALFVAVGIIVGRKIVSFFLDSWFR